MDRVPSKISKRLRAGAVLFVIATVASLAALEVSVMQSMEPKIQAGWEEVVEFDHLNSVNNWRLTRDPLPLSEKYIVVSGWFGRFANNINMIRNALEIAKDINRTLIVAASSYQNVKFWDIFDFEHLMKEMEYKIVFRKDLNKTALKEMPKCEDIRDHQEFIERYQDSSDSVLVLHSYTPYYKCTGHERLVKFYQSLKPSQKYSEKLKQMKESLFGSATTNYVAVHLRKMESVCYNHARKHFLPNFQENLQAMCNITYGLVSSAISKIYPELISKSFPIYVASDLQDPDRDADFKKNGAIFYDFKKDPTIGEKGSSLYFGPALDFFLLIDSDTLIGNSMSSFSSIASAIRVSQKNQNHEILSWPLIFSSNSVEDFWKCSRFEFWCTESLPIC